MPTSLCMKLRPESIHIFSLRAIKQHLASRALNLFKSQTILSFDFCLGNNNNNNNNNKFILRIYMWHFFIYDYLPYEILSIYNTQGNS